MGRQGKAEEREPGSAGKGDADGDKPAKGLRYRHDGFTPGKQRAFLEGLKETGCVEDACRAAGISDTTAYRTRRKLPEFARSWNVALAMAATPVDMIAFERATIGADKVIIREGKVVQIERRPSDVILRAIMQNTTRGRDAAEREAMKAELKRELYQERLAERDRFDKTLADELMGMIARTREGMVLTQGYTLGPDGQLAPPGYRVVRDDGRGAEAGAD